mgnify:CR=1 FL=1
MLHGRMSKPADGESMQGMAANSSGNSRLDELPTPWPLSRQVARAARPRILPRPSRPLVGDGCLLWPGTVFTHTHAILCNPMPLCRWPTAVYAYGITLWELFVGGHAFKVSRGGHWVRPPDRTATGPHRHQAYCRVLLPTRPQGGVTARLFTARSCQLLATPAHRHPPRCTS